MPVAYMPNLGKVTLIQLDGVLTPEEYEKCVNTAIGGCKLVYEIQKNALREKFFGESS
jgi:exosome complex component RRP41